MFRTSPTNLLCLLLILCVSPRAASLQVERSSTPRNTVKGNLRSCERYAVECGSAIDSSCAAPVEAKTVEIETTEGWRDLNADESSTRLRSEMKGLPGLLGKVFRVRILGPDGEKKLEFNVPVSLEPTRTSCTRRLPGLEHVLVAFIHGVGHTL